MAVGDKYLYTAGEDRMIKSWNLIDMSEHLCIVDTHENNIAAMLCLPGYLISSSLTVIHVRTVV